MLELTKIIYQDKYFLGRIYFIEKCTYTYILKNISIKIANKYTKHCQLRMPNKNRQFLS